MDNPLVLDRCVGFLSSMSEIAAPEHIGCQIYARTPTTEAANR